MFAQIFLGIAMIIQGILRLLNPNIFLSEKAKNIISEKKLYSFQKGLTLSNFLLGILFIAMGIIEKMNVFQTPNIIAIYIILAAIPLLMILVNNKKYSGNYWLK